MNFFTSSFYYPHHRLNVLCRNYLLPLAEKIKMEHGVILVNYHLSRYKGENVAASFDSPEKARKEEIREFITGEAERFFMQFPADTPEITLPVNQLFLDIPPNTRHFWEISPFAERKIVEADPKTDQRVKRLLSWQCLRHISWMPDMEKDQLYKLYIQLLVLFQKVLYEEKHGNEWDFAARVLARLKDLKKNARESIVSLEQTVRNESASKNESTRLLILETREQSEFSDSFRINMPLVQWMSLLKIMEDIRVKSAPEQKDSFYLNLFFNITQKISLEMDELIRAVVMLTEHRYSNEKNVNNGSPP